MRNALSILFAIIGVSLLLQLQGCGPSSPPPSFRRAIWVTRWDYRTVEDVRSIIRNCANNGFDTVLFQVRGNATTFYPSRLEPWAEEFGFHAPRPFFDPLAIACEEAHRHHIALHAWINAVPGWRGKDPPTCPRQLYNSHPDWFLYDENHARQPLQDRYYVALNVCLPEVREHIAAICAEVAQRYPVDGIHLDYIRFLERVPGHDYPRDAETLRLYHEATGHSPDDDLAAWEKWKTDQVSELVRLIARRVRLVRRNVILSAAVMRTPGIARAKVDQDWTRWLDEGWIDAAVPMQYDTNDERYEKRTRECVEGAGGKEILMGIGAWQQPDPKQTLRQIDFADKSCQGYALFAYSAFFPSPADETSDIPIDPVLRDRRRARVLPLPAR